MSSHSAVAPLALAVGALLISMVSYQCGASLAKHLFSLVGAQGAPRIGWSSLVAIIVAATGTALSLRRPALTEPLPN